ncbi:phosphotransferase enzyme family protein [Actinoplanes teichomyceticus]|uniref:Phosphotransferase family enzyme n=1 Tax=Actinoplanes teichomyceticus TaxID=1867 RepID=A0A561VSA4_ACTTI|nr:aminoglycoside phosphotransferase family protein [Actinoplanes teichomyceticus]TWG14486.1 phosphotransferase family enzyme [Actinoplanes teichomyceticus]GIF16290.1 aminoglycoside phosphotransferase [Actinoplanes teichomyceticus]
MFVEQRTRPVLAKVCRLVDRSADDAVLLRHHTNAVYAVDDLVIKIAPPAIGVDTLRRVVDLVQWLAKADFPTVHLAAGFEQPLTVEGYGVTVWERLDGAIDRPVETGELGELLRRLHSLELPPWPMPQLDPMPGIRHSISASAILAADDRILLTERLDDLTSRLRTVRSPLGWGLIQTDPQIRNALRRHDGTAVLADWDGARIGDRVWDVATVAVHCRRFGNDHGFDAFVQTYGWDPRHWAEFEDLCQLRELQMITTNARKSLPGTPAAAEVHRRIAGLRRGSRELTAWTIL